MKNTVAAILIIVSAATSFLVGTRVGVASFTSADAQYQASITAGELRLLDLQRFQDLRTAKEIELNAHLASHGRHMESHLRWLWPELHAADNRAINNAVQYRISHPFAEPDLSKQDNWSDGVDLRSSFAKSVIAGQKQNQALVDRVLKTYAP